MGSDPSIEPAYTIVTLAIMKLQVIQSALRDRVIEVSPFSLPASSNPDSIMEWLVQQGKDAIVDASKIEEYLGLIPKAKYPVLSQEARNLVWSNTQNKSTKRVWRSN